MNESIPAELRHRVSTKSYYRAVVLCATSGMLDLHWFYLERPLYGYLDLGATLSGVAFLLLGPRSPP